MHDRESSVKVLLADQHVELLQPFTGSLKPRRSERASAGVRVAAKLDMSL